MAINAYVGLMGSGKSYEVVSGPVCDAIAKGRRVVTNVAGINEAKIHEYLLQKNPALDVAKLGAVVHVTDASIMEPAFFPDADKPDVASVVQAGDLVAIDEAWRFWDGKLPVEHMQFFRMHRHYVHPVTGVACDVALMTQDVSGLARALRTVIEVTFRMHKLKSLGAPKTYRVEMYEGWKQTSRGRIGTFIRTYSKDVFPLYKSYDGDNAKELQVDKRQNVLANPRLIMTAVFVLCLFVVGGYQVRKFFKRPDNVQQAKAEQPSKSPGQSVAPGSSPVPAQPKSESRTDFSAEWRIAGVYEANGDRYVVVADQLGRLRVESPSQFHGAGIAMIGNLNGERIAPWTGARSQASAGAPFGGGK